MNLKIGFAEAVMMVVDFDLTDRSYADCLLLRPINAPNRDLTKFEHARQNALRKALHVDESREYTRMWLLV